MIILGDLIWRQIPLPNELPKHIYFDAVTKRVGEGKRFSCIPANAADNTDIGIPVVCPEEGFNDNDECKAILTPRLLWVSWNIISTAIDNAKAEQGPVTFFVIYDHSRYFCQIVIYDHSRSLFQNPERSDHDHDLRSFCRSRPSYV